MRILRRGASELGGRTGESATCTGAHCCCCLCTGESLTSKGGDIWRFAAGENDSPKLCTSRDALLFVLSIERDGGVVYREVGRCCSAWHLGEPLPCPPVSLS